MTDVNPVEVLGHIESLINYGDDILNTDELEYIEDLIKKDITEVD